MIDLPELAALVGTPEDLSEVYDAVVDGIVRFVGDQEVVIGLSGGADSGVMAALAAEALGGGRIWGVAMPGPHSSSHSLSDARASAEAIGARFSVVPITDPYDATLAALHGSDDDPGPFAGTEANVAEQNIQARLRAVVLMALTNRFGGLVINTSNRSELLVGYGTLYGDLVGAVSPFAEVHKSGPAGVWALGREANRRAGRPVVPESTLTKPPSAELAPGQRDDADLPPYEELDLMLSALADVGMGTEDTAAVTGMPPAVVERLAGRITTNAFKALQVPPAISLADTALGRRRDGANRLDERGAPT